MGTYLTGASNVSHCEGIAHVKEAPFLKKGTDMSKIVEKYKHGYKSKLNANQKRMFRTRFSEKSIWKGMAWVILYLLSIYTAIALSYWCFMGTISPILSCGIILFCVLFVARQMRALENIVHFGSHNNFSQRKRLNDWATNLLAAWPMLQDVRQYRDFHIEHHGGYGSHTDPCKIRLESIGVDNQKITTHVQLILVIMRWMPSYVREYYHEVNSRSNQLAIFIAWHLVVGLAVGVSFSWNMAAFTLVMWIVVMFGVLPFLRSVAEFSEHDYKRGDSVMNTTFNNLGLADHLLIHPAGDAWHALHHLHPTVSWWKQRAAHRFLMKHDSAYGSVLHRDSLLQ